MFGGDVSGSMCRHVTRSVTGGLFYFVVFFVNGTWNDDCFANWTPTTQ